MSSQTIRLITGATGKQGGAALKQLLSDSPSSGSSIRILTRNPDSASAKKLADKGVQVFKGDLKDTESLRTALKGVTSAFLMSTSVGDTSEGEVKQGKTFIDIAKESGIKHIVYTSVGDADKATIVPHFQTKWEIEQYLRGSGLSHTILRPVAFMDNIPTPPGIVRALLMGLLTTMWGKTPVKWVATEDIGIVAAKALENPERYDGKTVDIAGDELSMDSVTGVFEKVDGARPWRAWIPFFLTRLMPYDFRMMSQYFREGGYSGAVKSDLLSEMHPNVMNWETYIRKQRKERSD